VINPQDGHILCDPYPAIFGSLRILQNTRIANSAISRPTEILIALTNVLLFGDLGSECFAPGGEGAFDFAAN
jgi:hypothetical protein